jgi:ParB/RepB/Spo0J family partition protein
MSDRVQIVPRTSITPAVDKEGERLNPRTVFGGLEELGESLLERGLDVPLIVRPGRTLDVFELVDGERRWLASDLVGLEELPIICRPYTDEDVRTIAAANREALSALEEATNYDAMMKGNIGLTAGGVARAVGRSVQHVMQRLRLLALVPPLRALLDEGKLDHGAAMLLAQQPTKTQLEASKPILVCAGQQDRVSREDVQRAIERFCHVLEEATWEMSDATLVPKAGACTTCPKQTGAQGVLFEAADAAAICLDDACWTSKCNAAWDLKAAEAQRMGLRVLSGDEAKGIVNQWGGTEPNATHVPITGSARVGGHERRLADLLPPDTERAVVRGHQGEPVEVVARPIVERAVREAERLEKESTSKRSKGKAASASKEVERALRAEKAEREKAAIRRRTYELTVEVVGNQVIAKRVDLRTALTALLHGLIEISWSEARKAVAKNRQLVEEDETPEEQLHEDVQRRENDEDDFACRQLVGLGLELIAARLVSSQAHTAPEVPAAFKGLKVDMKKIEALAKEELERKAAKKKPPKSKEAPLERLGSAHRVQKPKASKVRA